MPQKSSEIDLIDIDSAEGYTSFGVVCHAQGQFEKAVAAYKSAISINSEDANTHLNLGITYIAQGQMLEAVNALQKAI